MTIQDAALPFLSIHVSRDVSGGDAHTSQPGPEPGVLNRFVCMFRNMAGHSFPRHMTPAAAGKFLAGMETGLRGRFDSPTIVVQPEPLPSLWLETCKSAGIPAPLPPPSFTRFLLGDQGRAAVLLNQDHHVQFLGYAASEQDAMTQLTRGRDFFARLEGQNAFAVHPDLGFLCADPAWLGSGLRVRTLLCLPLLSAAPDRLVVEGLLAGRFLRLRPWQPDQAGAQAFMVLETASCLGIHEDTQVRELAESTRLLLHYERGLAAAHDADRADRAWRASGILANARKLGARELLDLATDLSRGLLQGDVEGISWSAFAMLPYMGLDPVVDVLARVRGLPVHSDFRNTVRAELVRSILDGSFGR